MLIASVPQRLQYMISVKISSSSSSPGYVIELKREDKRDIGRPEEPCRKSKKVREEGQQA